MDSAIGVLDGLMTETFKVLGVFPVTLGFQLVPVCAPTPTGADAHRGAAVTYAGFRHVTKATWRNLGERCHIGRGG